MIKDDGPQRHTFTVTADGPFGPMPLTTYVVDLADWRGVVDRPAGSLHELTRAVKELTGMINNRPSTYDEPPWQDDVS